MIFELGWAALAAIFTFSIAMVVWGRNGDGSIDIQLKFRLFKFSKLKQISYYRFFFVINFYNYCSDIYFFCFLER